MNYLIAGLGNIETQYASTRHNVGFMVLDFWAQESGALFLTQRYGDLAEISFKGRRFILLKPSTYMNLSGNAIRYYLQKYKMEKEQLLVICDDLNLPFGSLRMRKSGSSGGHNGLKNIEELLQTKDYPRIRIGIGNKFAKGEQVDFVLGQLASQEQEEMPTICKRVVQGIKDFATIGLDRAMNILNTTLDKHNDKQNEKQISE